MNLLQCYFHLDGGKYATLSVPGVGFFPAFSGNGSATNQPDSANLPNIGPIPPGRYYILLRGLGGWYTQTKIVLMHFSQVQIEANGLLYSEMTE